MVTVALTLEEKLNVVQLLLRGGRQSKPPHFGDVFAVPAWGRRHTVILTQLFAACWDRSLVFSISARHLTIRVCNKSTDTAFEISEISPFMA